MKTAVRGVMVAPVFSRTFRYETSVVSTPVITMVTVKLRSRVVCSNIRSADITSNESEERCRSVCGMESIGVFFFFITRKNLNSKNSDSTDKLNLTPHDPQEHGETSLQKTHHEPFSVQRRRCAL